MTDDPILRQRRVALTQADTGLLLRRMMQEIPELKVVDAASLTWPADTERPHLRYWDGRRARYRRRPLGRAGRLE